MLEPATLVFIRHAEASNSASARQLCGWCDACLTARGRAEVECLRRRLSAEPPFSACYTSPLQRAAMTAAAAPPSLQPVPLDSLREIHCGDLEGMRLADVEARYPDLWARNLSRKDDGFAWPGGESYRDFRRRVIAAVEQIAERHSAERVLVFTHSGFINQVMGVLAGAPAARWDLYIAGTASVTEVRWSSESRAVVRFNDRSHLEHLSGLKRAC